MTVPSIIAAAQGLAPAVHAAADEAERTRQTPPALAAALTGPASTRCISALGGRPETPPLVAFRVVEELSKADGSVGWCAMIASALSLNVGRLPPEVGRELAGTPADFAAPAPPALAGAAARLLAGIG